MFACFRCFGGAVEATQQPANEPVIAPCNETQRRHSDKSFKAKQLQAEPESSITELKHVHLALCGLESMPGWLLSNLVETLADALPATVVRLYGIDNASMHPGDRAHLVLLAASCRVTGTDAQPHQHACSIERDPAICPSLPGWSIETPKATLPQNGTSRPPTSQDGPDMGAAMTASAMNRSAHLNGPTPISRSACASLEEQPRVATQPGMLLLQMALLKKKPVTYRMTSPSPPRQQPPCGTQSDPAATAAIPADCLHDADQYGTQSFAALPLQANGSQPLGVLWIAFRDQDAPSGAALLADAAALQHLALLASLALSGAGRPSQLCHWLAGTLRRLTRSASLHGLVWELCDAVCQYVRQQYLLDVTVQPVLVPPPPPPAGVPPGPSSGSQGPSPASSFCQPTAFPPVSALSMTAPMQATPPPRRHRPHLAFMLHMDGPPMRPSVAGAAASCESPGACGALPVGVVMGCGGGDSDGGGDGGAQELSCPGTGSEVPKPSAGGSAPTTPRGAAVHVGRSSIYGHVSRGSERADGSPCIQRQRHPAESTPNEACGSARRIITRVSRAASGKALSPANGAADSQLLPHPVRNPKAVPSAAQPARVSYTANVLPLTREPGNVASSPAASAALFTGPVPPCVPTLCAKAFQLSHTLLELMLDEAEARAQAEVPETPRTHGSPRFPGTPKFPASARSKLAEATFASVEALGSLVGPAIPDCARWVQDVRHPSRDVYLLMTSASAATAAASGAARIQAAAAAVAAAPHASGAASTSTFDSRGSGFGAFELEDGGAAVSGNGQGLQSLILLGQQLEGGAVLGLYLAFSVQLPATLLAAIHSSCASLLDKAFSKLFSAKLRTEFAPELATIAAGIPGSYAVVPTATAAADATAAATAAATATAPRHLRARVQSSPAAGHAPSCGAFASAASNSLGAQPAAREMASDLMERPVAAVTAAAAAAALQPRGRLARTTTMLDPYSSPISDSASTGEEQSSSGVSAYILEGDLGSSSAGAEMDTLTATTTGMTFQHMDRDPGLPVALRANGLLAENRPLAPPHPARKGTGSRQQARARSCATSHPPRGLAARPGSQRAILSPRQHPHHQHYGHHPHPHAHPLPHPDAWLRLGQPGSSAGLSGAAEASGPLQGDCAVADAGALTSILAVQEVDNGSSMRAHMGLLVDAISTTLRKNSAAALAANSAAATSTDEHCRLSLDHLHEMDDLDELQMFDILGEGASGIVLRGRMGTTPVAVKLVEMPDADTLDSVAPDSADEATSATAAAAADGRAGDAAPIPADPAVTAPGGGLAGGTNGGAQQQQQRRRYQRCQARLDARRSMLRDAMELAVLSSISHINIVQCHGVYDNVLLERIPGVNGQRTICMLRRPLRDCTASPRSDSSMLGPLCTAIVTELCSHGSLASVLADRSFPRGLQTKRGSQGPVQREGAQPVAPSRIDLQGVYLTLLEIALALRHLHSRRLVHRDVKPANILLQSSPSDPRGWTCKLADFGFALVLDQQSEAVDVRVGALRAASASAAVSAAASASGTSGCSSPGNSAARLQPARPTALATKYFFGEAQRGSQLSPQAPARSAGGSHTQTTQPLCKANTQTATGTTTTRFTVQDLACGTVTHMAPEAMKRNSRIDASVDVFSFGVIMWELLCGRGNRPYPHLSPADIPRAVQAGLRPIFSEDVPKDYRRLAQACWSTDPAARPRAAEVVSAIKAQLAQYKEGPPAGPPRVPRGHRQGQLA